MKRLSLIRISQAIKGVGVDLIYSPELYIFDDKFGWSEWLSGSFILSIQALNSIIDLSESCLKYKCIN